jgi:hypothetical protein
MTMRESCLLRLSLAVVMLLLASSIQATTLREAFELAGPGNGYDKYIELETGVVYSGGLLIGPVFSPLSWTLEGEEGIDVRIVGNGAILDLQGQQLCISYCDNRLDIDDCIVLNGNIRFRGMNTADYVVLPQGSVRYTTFYRTDDYGIRLQGAGSGITCERNLFVDALDTGNDFIYTHGASHEWLPTGSNVAFSIQSGYYGVPSIQENWSYHSDPEANAEMLAHFCLLCEYG